MRARRAAITFSRMPPTASTSPVRVSSPVIARVRASRWLRAREGRAVAMGMPGRGSAFGSRRAAGQPVVAGQGEQGRGHGDAGAGAVLGGGALRHVEVNVGLVEKSLVGTVALEVGHDVAVGDLGGFAHDVPQLAGG